MVQEQEQEQDVRLQMLNTLLKTPHRNLNSSYPMHQQIIRQDPLFYVRLAAWYDTHGEIRDHQELFITNLCLSSFEGHRDAGLALLRDLEPHRVVRVINFIRGEVVNKVTKEEKTVRGRPKTTYKVTKERVGLFRNSVPNSFITEVKQYLLERENDPAWFDSAVLGSRKYMRRMYKFLQIRPFTDRAQAVLFEGKPVEGTSLYMLKTLGQAKTPADQAKIIIEQKIPYRIASTVITTMSPTVLLALIHSMSDQELINNIGSLKKHGVFNNPDLKELVSKRLEKAKKSKKVSALKPMEAIKSSGVEADIAQKLEEVADHQIKSKGRITRSTALFIDKSDSMKGAVEVGKRMASMISAVMDAKFYCYAFDAMPYELKATSNDLASWERAFAGISASGRTCNGAPFRMMGAQNQVVEQIMMITDEGETDSPTFLKAYGEYCEKMNVRPSVFILRCGALRSKKIYDKLVRAGVEVDDFDFNDAETDYYSLPQLISFLSKPSKLDLLIEIMSHPVPQRRLPTLQPVMATT